METGRVSVIVPPVIITKNDNLLCNASLISLLHGKGNAPYMFFATPNCYFC